MSSTISLITSFEQTPGGSFLVSFFSQPVGDILNDLLIYLSWIPITIVLIFGLLEVWKDRRQSVWMSKQRNVLLSIHVPRDTEQSPKAVENIFAACSGTVKIPNFKDRWIEGQERRIFSFELVSIDGYIQYIIRTNERYRDLIEAAVYSHYPDAEIHEVDDYTKSVPDKFPDDEYEVTGDEYRISGADYLPIRTWPMFEHSLSQELKDPLGYLLELLSKLKVGEQIWIQIIVIPTLDKWKEAGDKFIKETFGLKEETKTSVVEKMARGVFAVPKAILTEVVGEEILGESTDAKDKGMDEMFKMFKVTEQEREVVKSVAAKIAKTGFHCKIRFIYTAPHAVYNRKNRNDAIKAYFRQFAHLDGNAIFSYPKTAARTDYFWHHWFYYRKKNDMIQAYKARAHTKGSPPFILNIEELATLWHFPTPLIKAPLILKTVSKRAEPPSQLAFATEGEEHALTPALVDQKKELVDLEEGAVQTSGGLSFEIEGVDQPVAESDTGTIKKPFIESEPESEDLPQVQAPTKPMTAETAKETPGAIESVIESSQAPDTVPDVIKVLISPGVELEDVGIKPVVEDETDDAPDNLPI